MKRTKHYKLPYLELGDILYRSDETERWKTADYALSSIACSGVEQGLTLSYNSSNHYIQIETGSYWAGGVWFSSTLAPTFAANVNNTYAVYADSYLTYTTTNDGLNYSKAVLHPTFGITTSSIPTTAVTLGHVHIAADNTSNVITSTRTPETFNGKGRKNVTDMVASHKHSGEENGPAKVNLATEVTGALDSKYLAIVPGSKIISNVTLSAEDAKNLSHIGRVKEATTFSQKPTFTRDYVAYYGDASNGDILVYLNGNLITTGFSFKGDYNLNGSLYTEVVFATPRSVSDRVTIVTDLRNVELVGGAWDSGDCTVYVNDVIADESTYTLDKERGSIKFITYLDPSDQVTITISGVYVTDVGTTIHDDIDSLIGDETAFLNWWPSYITESNTEHINDITRSIMGSSVMGYQCRFVALPEDFYSTSYNDQTFNNPDDPAPGTCPINIDTSTVVVNPTMGTLVYVPGPSADGTVSIPVDNYKRSDGVKYIGQTFTSINYLFRIQLYLSRSSEEASYDVAFAIRDASSGPDLANPVLWSTTISASSIPRNGGWVSIPVNPNLTTLLANHAYILTMDITGAVNTADYPIWWRASQSYPDGAGYYYGTEDGSTYTWNMFSGTTNDNAFILYTSTSYGAGSPINATITFDEAARLVANPIISIVLDCSGSTIDSDATGSRFDAAKTFITSVEAACNNTGVPDADKPLFDLIVFSSSYTAGQQYSANTSVISAPLGFTSAVTPDTTSILATLDYLKANSSLWSGGTPLTDVTAVACERLKLLKASTDPTRYSAILLLTDGLTNSDSKTQENVITDYILPNNIVTYSVGFGSSSLSDVDLFAQAQYLYEFSNRSNGRYYSDSSTTGLDTILADITSEARWAFQDFTRSYAFESNVLLHTITPNCTLPGSSYGTIDVYCMAEDDLDWDIVSRNVQLNQDSPVSISIERIVKYVKVVIHLHTGSIPTVPSMDLVYEVLHKSYVFTNPYSVVNTPQVISFSCPSVYKQSNCLYTFKVGLGNMCDWDKMLTIPEPGRLVIPSLLDKSLTAVSGKTLTYAADRITGWPGDWLTVVTQNGTTLAETQYSANSNSGEIVLLVAPPAGATLTLSLIPPKKYVIGLELQHADQVPPVSMNYSWMYSVRPT